MFRVCGSPLILHQGLQSVVTLPLSFPAELTVLRRALPSLAGLELVAMLCVSISQVLGLQEHAACQAYSVFFTSLLLLHYPARSLSCLLTFGRVSFGFTNFLYFSAFTDFCFYLFLYLCYKFKLRAISSFLR